MTNRDTRAPEVVDQGHRETWALKQALELLGFDVDALVARMCESRESYWQRLALQSTLVSFDKAQACVVEPCISPAILAEAEAWLGSVRLGNATSILRRTSLGGGVQ